MNKIEDISRKLSLHLDNLVYNPNIPVENIIKQLSLQLANYLVQNNSIDQFSEAMDAFYIALSNSNQLQKLGLVTKIGSNLNSKNVLDANIRQLVLLTVSENIKKSNCEFDLQRLMNNTKNEHHIIEHFCGNDMIELMKGKNASNAGWSDPSLTLSKILNASKIEVENELNQIEENSDKNLKNDNFGLLLKARKEQINKTQKTTPNNESNESVSTQMSEAISESEEKITKLTKKNTNLSAFSSITRKFARFIKLSTSITAAFATAGLLWLTTNLIPKVVSQIYKRDVKKRERVFEVDEAIRCEYSAVCAADCYNDDIHGRKVYVETNFVNLERIASFGDKTSSFGGAVYLGSGIGVLALRGTEMTDKKDWDSNLTQHFLGASASPQYQQAKAIVSNWLDNAIVQAKKGNWPIKQMVITGHSLGGGLAQYATLSCSKQIKELGELGINVKVEVFNSASLGNATVRELEKNHNADQLGQQIVSAYRASGDPLNNRILGRGKIYGFEDEFEAGDDGFFSVASHQMAIMLDFAKRKTLEAISADKNRTHNFTNQINEAFDNEYALNEEKNLNKLKLKLT